MSLSKARWSWLLSEEVAIIVLAADGMTGNHPIRILVKSSLGQVFKHWLMDM
jgi:hypothetical protein